MRVATKFQATQIFMTHYTDTANKISRINDTVEWSEVEWCAPRWVTANGPTWCAVCCAWISCTCKFCDHSIWPDIDRTFIIWYGREKNETRRNRFLDCRKNHFFCFFVFCCELCMPANRSVSTQSAIMVPSYATCERIIVAHATPLFWRRIQTEMSNWEIWWVENEMVIYGACDLKQNVKFQLEISKGSIRALCCID